MKSIFRRAVAIFIAVTMSLSVSAAATVSETDDFDLPISDSAQNISVAGDIGDAAFMESKGYLADEDEIESTPNLDEEDEQETPNDSSDVSFPDITDHWAREALEQAVGDGLLSGYPDGMLHPNDYISTAHMLVIFCRLLDAQKELSDASIGLNGDEWYAPYATKAAYMRIIDSANGISEPSPRKDASVTIARAFQYVAAEPDYSVLGAFSDSSGLLGDQKDAMAMLISNSVIQGDGNSLNIDGFITRAEFITIIYRIIDGITPAKDASGTLGGSILSGDGKLSDVSVSRGAWFDCSGSTVEVSEVSSPLVVLRSQGDGDLNIKGTSKIKRLVLAGGGSEERVVTISDKSSVETLVVGASAEKVTIGNEVDRVEIVGDYTNVIIKKDVKELVISGNGNTITVDGSRTDSLRVLSGAEGNKISLKGNVEKIELWGANSVVDLSGDAKSLVLAEKNSRIEGTGKVTTIDQKTSYCTIKVKYETLNDNIDNGIYGATVSVYTPSVLPAGEALTATATINSPVSGKVCRAVWSVDGNVVQESEISLISGEQKLTLSHSYNYSRDMQTSSTVGFTLRHITTDNEEQIISASTQLQVENYGEDHYSQYDVDRVLGIVSYNYQGNYTLKWAMENDYQDFEKEVWVNANGYGSNTGYLIWVNRACQRVNIFEGSAGNWKLIKSCIVGTGASRSQTPVGVYTIWARSAAGWTTGTYNVRPVVNFKTGSGYAFHSRLYNPGHNYLTDGSIGFPVSHGCVRMYDEDIKWIYDWIPNGTTVVVH